MRVVVDTNVLISAGLKADSAPRRAVLWVKAHGVLLKSEPTELELRQTLLRPKLLHRAQVGGFLNELLALIENAQPVDVVETVRACRDSDDDKFLEVAINGNADVIVTGDFDPLVLDPFRSIRILDPTGLLRSVGL